MIPFNPLWEQHVKKKYIIVDRTSHHFPYYISSDKHWKRNYSETADFLFFDTEEEAKSWYKRHFGLKNLFHLTKRTESIISIEYLENVYYHDLQTHGSIPKEKEHTIAFHLRDQYTVLVTEPFHPKHRPVSSSWQPVDMRYIKQYNLYSRLVLKK